jgi:uncharacterized membrane protein YgcG
MGRDSGGVGSSRYITVKTGQGWLEVAQSAAGNSTADQVAAYAVKLAKQNKNKKPRPGMVVQNPAYNQTIGMTPNPAAYQPNQALSLWNRPGLPNVMQQATPFQMPQAPGPYQVQAPSWAANYQQGAEQRKTGMPATTPAPAPSWAKNYQTLAPWRNSWMPSLAPAMPAGFYPTPTMLPDTWAQSYPRTAEAIAAQIESGYYPSTISALDQYQLQVPDELLKEAGYEKQPWGGWARMGPERLPAAPTSGRYASGGYGGRGYRGGRGGGGGSSGGGGGGGYGGGYSTSGRMLESATNGLVSWRI